jgi:hypothetical protein
MEIEKNQWTITSQTSVMGMAIKQECSVPTEAWVSLAKQINAS